MPISIIVPVNFFLRILVCAVLVGLFPALAQANLILNPSNEAALVGGEIPDWVERSGSGYSTNWTQRATNPTALDGTYYFFAGTGTLAELYQDIDVTAYAAGIATGAQLFNFSGFVRGYISGDDTSRIIIEYRDSTQTVLEFFDSGELLFRDSWEEVIDARFAPAGTETIRVRLIADRYSGSNNDGYFDNLSLTTNLQVPGPASGALLAPLVLLAARCRRSAM